MGFHEVLKKRHSVRAYASKPVPQEALDRVIEAFIGAPTAANKQPLGLLVIETAGREEELAKVYGRAWFTQAPLVLAVCTEPARAWTRSDGKNFADVDAAISFEHAVLAAAAEGLGTCWIGAFDPDAAKEVFGLPAGVEPVALTPLGYPASTSSQPRRLRKPREKLVHHNQW